MEIVDLLLPDVSIPFAAGSIGLRVWMAIVLVVLAVGMWGKARSATSCFSSVRGSRHLRPPSSRLEGYRIGRTTVRR